MGKHHPTLSFLWNILPTGFLLLIPLFAGFGQSVLASTGAGEIVLDVSDVLRIEIQGEPMLSITRQVDESGWFPGRAEDAVDEVRRAEEGEWDAFGPRRLRQDFACTSPLKAIYL